MSDPFATAATRDKVLAAWSASPSRFREDANAEEDLALGGYRDRLVVELAQNAADAAARAGRPGVLRLTLRDDPAAWDASGGPVLVAANTGDPLTSDGVEALATLRASAKRDDEGAIGSGPDQGAPAPQVVGRFGVGFAAVLAVTDEPAVLSRTGGVRFSRDDTAALVTQAAETSPGLSAELRRRDGHVPVLRLPFAAEGEPPAGFDTAVVLPLRDEPATNLVRRLLAEADDALLLALPHLDRIEIDDGQSGAGAGAGAGAGDRAGEPRVLTGVDARWRAYRSGGVWTPAERATLLADRPTEERTRPFWSVLWAVPRTREGGAADALGALGGSDAAQPSSALSGVVHAPTPTDEPLSLPAMLLASFPLDPTRRHVAAGPLTDRLVEEAASAYAEVLRDRAEAGDDIGPMVPVGLPSGRLDGALRDAVLRRLPATPLLRAAEDQTLLRPRDAVVIEDADDAVVRLLAPVVGGLVTSRRADRAAFDALGVRRIGLANLVDELAAVGEAYPPDWWQRLYVALAPVVADPVQREALGALPVPLADGRVVRGARGLLLADDAAASGGTGPGGTGQAAGGTLPSEALAVLASYGLRLVHRDAATGRAADTLERLGAVLASPRALVDDGSVRAAVDDSADSDDPAATADGVLALVTAATAAGDLEPGDLPWLGDLALPDDEGELAPANSLVLPGSEAEAILDPDEFAPVDPALVERWGAQALETVGVVRALGLVSATDVDLTALPDTLADLADVDDWADDASASLSADGGAAWVGELVGVRDLNYVRDDAWPRALRLLTGDRAARRALVEPVRIRAVGRPDDRGVEVPSYASWWVRRHVRVDGRTLDSFADPDADPAVTGLLAAPPAWLAAIDPSARAALGLVRRIGDLDASGVRRLLRRLADPDLDVSAATMIGLWTQFGALDPAAAAGTPPAQVRVLAGTGTAVVDAADAVVVDAPMWAQRTDLGGQVLAPARAAETLAELLDLPLASELAAGEVDADGEGRDVPAVVRQVLPDVPATWWEHDDLRSDGHAVDWWVDRDGRPHAATGDGLARALAWAADRWELRYALAALLAEPERAGDHVVESAFESVDRGAHH